MRCTMRNAGTIHTHISYYVDYNAEDVNVAFSYSLFPYNDIQKYGDYWTILRRRPGAAALTIPEYMPNKQHRYKEALGDFERAGLTLAPSRYWLESPLNQLKVEFIYPYFSYFMGNKVNIKRMNKDLNLNRFHTRRNRFWTRSSHPSSTKSKATSAAMGEKSTRKKQWPHCSQLQSTMTQMWGFLLTFMNQTQTHGTTPFLPTMRTKTPTTNRIARTQRVQAATFKFP